MWQNISLDRDGWDAVTPAEKNGLIQHLRTYFDLDSIQDSSKWQGIDTMLTNRYRGRKSLAKIKFNERGGYGNLDEVRRNIPPGLSDENWNKAVDYFNTDKHRRRSASNALVREKQTIKNRGGTRSYSSACFKKEWSRVEAFSEAHVDKQGNWDCPEVEEHYHNLVRELAQQTQVAASSSNPTPVDEPSIFEQVLGIRRGHIRGIGHKPPGRVSASTSQQQSASSQAPQANLNYAELFRDPEFCRELTAFLNARSTHNDEEADDEDEGGLD